MGEEHLVFQVPAAAGVVGDCVSFSCQALEPREVAKTALERGGEGQEVSVTCLCFRLAPSVGGIANGPRMLDAFGGFGKHR